MSDEWYQDGKWKFSFVPEYADCIARTASLWSQLEYHVHCSIWTLADVQPMQGACMTSQIFSLNAKLNSLLALAKLRQLDPKIISDINRFTSDSRDAADKRNRIIHDAWLLSIFEPEAMGRLRITADKKLSFSIETVPLCELVNDVKVIEQCVFKFYEIRKAIEAALPSLQDMSRATLHPIIETPQGR